MNEKIDKLLDKFVGFVCLVGSIVCIGLAVHGVANEEIKIASKSAKILLTKKDNLIGYWLGVALFFFGGIFSLLLGIVGLLPDRPSENKRDGRGILFALVFLSVLLLGLLGALIWAARR